MIWNKNIPMYYMGVILKFNPGAHKFQDIQRQIKWCLDLLDSRKHVNILEDTVVEICLWLS